MIFFCENTHRHKTVQYFRKQTLIVDVQPDSKYASVSAPLKDVVYKGVIK